MTLYAINAKIFIIQILRERGHAYRKNEEISGWNTNINTWKLNWNVLRIIDVFLDQKRVKVCEHMVKMAPCVDLINILINGEQLPEFPQPSQIQPMVWGMTFQKHYWVDQQFCGILSILILHNNILLYSLHYVKSSLTWVFNRSFSVPCAPLSMLGIDNGHVT